MHYFSNELLVYTFLKNFLYKHYARHVRIFKTSPFNGNGGNDLNLTEKSALKWKSWKPNLTQK